MTTRECQSPEARRSGDRVLAETAHALTVRISDFFSSVFVCDLFAYSSVVLVSLHTYLSLPPYLALLALGVRWWGDV